MCVLDSAEFGVPLSLMCNISVISLAIWPERHIWFPRTTKSEVQTGDVSHWYSRYDPPLSPGYLPGKCKMQRLNDSCCRSSRVGVSFSYKFSGWIRRFPLKLNQFYCRFLQKSPWPCSERPLQTTSNLIPRCLRVPSPVCPGRAFIFPAFCVCVCVCVCVAAKSSTDPVFSSHVSCPRQQLSHNPP